MKTCLLAVAALLCAEAVSAVQAGGLPSLGARFHTLASMLHLCAHLKPMFASVGVDIASLCFCDYELCLSTCAVRSSCVANLVIATPGCHVSAYSF